MSDIKLKYVISPITGRLIKVGSKKYFELVKDNYLKLNYKTRDNPVLYNGENAKEVKKNLVTDDNTVLHSRNNKIFKQRRKMTIKEHHDFLIEKAIDIIKNDIEELKDLSNDELDVRVQELIQQKLVDG